MDKLAVGTKDGQVFIHFEKPLTWISFDPHNALMIAEALVKHSRILLSQKNNMIIEVPKVQ